MSRSLAATSIRPHHLRSSATASARTISVDQEQSGHDRGYRSKLLWRRREIEVLEEERRRLARDLHDEAGHRLTAAILQLDAVVQRYSQDADSREGLEAARRLIQECAAGLHEVAFNLRPSILTDLGLAPAVRSLVRRAVEVSNLHATVELNGSPYRLPERIELTAFRIVQEALTNAMKYANATVVTVTLSFSEEVVVIDVADDGIGFEVIQSDAGPPRLGLRGIRERAELVGGEMRIQTKLGRGTTVWVQLPRSELL